MVFIRRKVVQHGPSTLIISLPSKWVKEHNVKKGDELDVSEHNNSVIISAKDINKIEKIELDISDFGKMIPRTIYSLYRRGVDELEIKYNGQDTFALIQNSLGNDIVGFELLETRKNYCLIKNVSVVGRDFDKLLRQTFLLLLSMAEEGYEVLKQNNLNLLKNLISLEKANNRFTNLCRRYLNTMGSEEFDKIGPLYYIVEQLERIADTFKYLYSYLTNLKENVEINKELLDNFNEINKNLRKFYNLFYKFDPKHVEEIKEKRDKIVKNLYSISSKIKKPHDIVLFHHLMELITDIFSLVDPYLTLAFKDASKVE